MNAPASDKFATVDLSTTFNADRDELDDTLRLVRRGDQYYGDQVFQGVPFSLGQAGQPNVILLGESDVEVEIRVQQKASYVLFLHAVEQAPARSMDGLPEFGGEGNDTLYGADGADITLGDDVDDNSELTRDDDWIDAGAGADTVRGGDGTDQLMDGVAEGDEAYSFWADWVDNL